MMRSDSSDPRGGTTGGSSSSSSSSPPKKQPAQQRPDEERATTTTTEAERAQQQALREASQVLDSMGNHQLDHFNLLGVVANPRGSQHGTAPPPNTPYAMSAVSSAHGIGSGIGGGGGGPGSTASSTHSGISAYLDPYNTFEYTINSITEQIEALNHVFQDWSTQYLEEYYYHDSSAAADATPESQLQELPPYLTHLDLTRVEGYLQQSGNLAQTFHTHHRERLEQQQKQQQLEQQIAAATSEQGSTTASSVSEEEATRNATSTSQRQTNNNNKVDLSDIPEIFFNPNFDLTEPRTFSDLLLASSSLTMTMTNDEDDNTSNLQQQQTQQEEASSEEPRNPENAFLEQSTNELFQIPPPDYFTGYLDKIEVALLDQVKQKSEAFFQETNRFAQLKEMVGELLMDVQRIRGLVQGQSRAIQSWQQVPQWDRKRKQLIYMERILEGSNEILRCKQCIGGLLSAKDDLGAVEQIQYARRLLAGIEEDDDDGDENDTNEGQAPQQAPDDQAEERRQAQHLQEKELPIELGRLNALKTVGEQLNQYESLVVKSLTEEVSEIFLEWNTSALVSMYGSSNGASSRASSQQEIQRRTLNIIESLQRCHSLAHMTKFYSGRLHDVIRMTVRTTVGEFAADSSSEQNSSKQGTSVSVSVGSMPLERFIDCLDMLFEQLLALLKSASGVDEFCQSEGVTLKDTTEDSGDQKSNGGTKSGDDTNGNAKGQAEVTHSSQTVVGAILASAAELSSKSIAELLRLRKEVHSMVSMDEIRQIWDTCMKFIEDVEKLSGHKCTALRSMLFVQAKAFVERKHESNMSALAAALDSERWTQCEVSKFVFVHFFNDDFSNLSSSSGCLFQVSFERQAALNRLCTGRAGVSTARRLMRSSSADEGASNVAKMPDAEVEGIRYKVVWSCLLLVEMIMTNIEAAAHFQNLASNVVGKVAELLRLFNSRSTQLVLGAGAIHSAARLKSINAKHLSLVTQCLGMTIAILPHIRAALMAQLPAKQHTLLNDLDKIKKEFADHNEKVLNKFVTIIGGIVEHGLAKHIGGIDFDERAKEGGADKDITCCVFLEGVLTNTRKMHQVLCLLLPPEHLQDVFSRIFAFLDQKTPGIFIAAAESESGLSSMKFSFPSTDAGKKRLLDEVDSVTTSLNALEGVFPWDFSATSILAKKLEYDLPDRSPTPQVVDATADPGNGDQTHADASEGNAAEEPGDTEADNRSESVEKTESRQEKMMKVP